VSHATIATPSPTGEPERSAVRPWWLRAMPWLGQPPPLTSRQWNVLGVLGAAALIDNYDLGVLGLALPQIQTGLGVAEADVGALTAVVRLGVIPALFITVLADRAGRRRLLLATILGFTVCTFLTAFVRSAAEFAALQLLARVFIAGQGMLAVVVIIEEFDANVRGWGIGMMGALGSLGHGLAAIIFSVVNLLPFGWRALYVVGVAPLLLIAWFRRTLSETPRFEQHRTTRATASGLHAALQPFRDLVRMYPGRIVALCAALMPVAFVFETSTLFASKFLQEVHHYSPGNVAAMYLTIGVLAPIGNVVAGSLGDRFGRKRIMIAGSLVNAAAIAGFYHVAGFWVPLTWGLMVMTLTMVLVLFAALGGELFPTSYRSTASGVRAVVATLGAALGLWVEGQLYGVVGSHAAAITLMLVVVPIAPLIIALTLPETAARELEEIAPERHN
jgi:putative MFS transporter